MQKFHSPESVRLLPQFDAYVLGISRKSEHALPSTHKNRVYRPQGWISAVVLVDGRMEGVWEFERHDARATVLVELFALHNAMVKDNIEAEASRLGDFWNADVEVIY